MGRTERAERVNQLEDALAYLSEAAEAACIIALLARQRQTDSDEIERLRWSLTQTRYILQELRGSW